MTHKRLFQAGKLPEFVVENRPRLEYNGLRDPNLAPYFATKKRRKMLKRQGLINEEGEINEYITRASIAGASVNRMLKRYQTSVRGPRRKQRSYWPSRTPGLIRKRESHNLKPLTAEDFKKIIFQYRQQSKL